MSTQNPWVAARPAASPGKRSPAVPRNAAFGTPPVFALADGGGVAKRRRTADETAARMAQAAHPKQQGHSAAEAVPHGDENAAVQVEDPLRKAPQGVQAASVPPVSRPAMEKSQASTLPAQRRPRHESQVKSLARGLPIPPLAVSSTCVGHRLVAPCCHHSVANTSGHCCMDMLIFVSVVCSADIAGHPGIGVRRCDAPEPGGLQAHCRRQGPAADPCCSGGPRRQQVHCCCLLARQQQLPESHAA